MRSTLIQFCPVMLVVSVLGICISSLNNKFISQLAVFKPRKYSLIAKDQSRKARIKIFHANFLKLINTRFQSPESQLDN